jgi:hypothetical protein
MFLNELFLKQLSILLISAVKFLVAAPTSYLFGYSYLHTILNTTVGGWIGVIFFYYTSRFIFSHFPFWKREMRRFYHTVLGIPKHRQIIMNNNREPKKVFTRRNRLIVTMRTKFGFPGLIILTPVLLSIPIGTFLILKYYSHRRNLLAWLSLSVMVWSVVISTFIRII